MNPVTILAILTQDITFLELINCALIISLPIKLGWITVKGDMAQPKLKSNYNRPLAGFDSSYSNDAQNDNPALLKTLDDATLLSSVVAGSKSAMAEIYDRYSLTCYAIAMRILDSAAAAEEVTRDVLLDVWRQPSDYISSNSVLPIWLTLTTRRRALEFRDLRGRTLDENGIPMPNPHELGISKHQAWRLDKFKRIVAALPADQKQVLELVWFKGLGNDELAQQTGLSLEKIHSRLHSALETLHNALDANE